MTASVPASMAIDQARELTALRHELTLYRALIRQAEMACADYLKAPHDDLVGAIQDLRQVAQSAKELAEHLYSENRLLRAALDLAAQDVRSQRSSDATRAKAYDPVKGGGYCRRCDCPRTFRYDETGLAICSICGLAWGFVSP